MKRKFNALGITCGVGSMLIGARDAGFNIVGNIEWRKYYHSGTFERNFPGSFLVHKIEEVPDEIPNNIDLVMGHPECGNFSNLNNRKEVVNTKAMDIPLFLDLCMKVNPRFIVMDNLPGSLEVLPMEFWAKKLKGYDLFFEWISNWGYGNIQKGRNRYFLIASKKEEKFAFIPGERENKLTVKDVIGDLYCARYGQIENHFYHTIEDISGRAKSLKKYNKRATFKDFQDYFKKQKSGHIMRYHAADGTIKLRFGLIKTHWDAHANVLTGTNPIVHPLTNLPLSIRERARIQGAPDDFVFIGEKLNEDHTWNHDKNSVLVKQTGKFMPVQFCRYVANQIMAHLTGSKFNSSKDRILKPNPLIDKAKKAYCKKYGYSNQDSACGYCWLCVDNE